MENALQAISERRQLLLVWVLLLVHTHLPGAAIGAGVVVSLLAALTVCLVCRRQAPVPAVCGLSPPRRRLRLPSGLSVPLRDGTYYGGGDCHSHVE